MNQENIKLLYIDLFSGAGGTSTGVEFAQVNGQKCARVVACVNHDINAILSHSENHPETLHFTEDIRTLELSPMVTHLNAMRVKYPEALVVLWASLECTNFSKAKGGQSRDADSRTLAEHLFRYIDAIDPDFIHIENVEEFMSWGDVDENGKPISMDRGRSYLRWVKNICKYGYSYDWKICNSADYGAYTARKRYFGQFAKKGLPISWPEPTHAKVVTGGGLFGRLERWKAVKDVLDLKDEGESIFTRKKPLSEKTLERIYAGLIKFVAGGKDKWILKYNSINGKTGKHIPPSIDEPSPVVSCQGRLGIVSANFLSAYYGNGDNVSSIDSPCPTVTTVDRFALATPQFLDMQYGNGSPAPIDAPAGTVTTSPKHNLVTLKPWIMNTNFNNVGASVDEPSQVITANRKWHYLMNTTLADGNELYIQVFETDSPAMVRIKEFMALYGIIDIKMRMLKIPELKQIMGFPKTYKLIGTQAEQKKYIGNAVEVNMSRALCAALAEDIYKYELEKVAI